MVYNFAATTNTGQATLMLATMRVISSRHHAAGAAGACRSKSFSPSCSETCSEAQDSAASILMTCLETFLFIEAVDSAASIMMILITQSVEPNRKNRKRHTSLNVC